MTTDQATVTMPKPMYTVLFTMKSYDSEAPYIPIGDPGELLADGFTWPHGLDLEVAPALSGLWYCLHLPKTAWDTVGMQLPGVLATLRERRKHLLVLAPVQAFLDGTVQPPANGPDPALVIAPDDSFDVVSHAAAEAGYLLPAIRSSELSNFTLSSHWAALTDVWRSRLQHLSGKVRFLEQPLSLDDPSAVAACALPLRRLRRQLGIEPSDEREVGAAGLLYARTMVELLTLMEEEDLAPAEAQAAFPVRMAEVAPRVRVPCTLGVPGMAPKYLSNVKAAQKRFRAAIVTASDTHVETPTISPEAHPDAEAHALAVIVAHQAVGDDSVSVITEAVPPAAFHALANLERHWAGKADPATVWKLLDRLNEAVEPLWTDELHLAISRSSALQVVSNFPLGLVRFPGDTAPLACRVPIAYSPLAPLTRALQTELGFEREVNFADGFRVLVAECISESDKVGRISRSAWSIAVEIFDNAAHNSSLTRVDTLSVSALRDAISTHAPDVLVISAHGFHDRVSNIAGLQIGSEPTLGFDLGPMPPLVILSACHSGPRGSGPVSVGDLLLREGATAVLSTLVPVDVRHNSTFMMRVLLYMAEVLAGREEHETVLEVWHRVQSGNVVNDVLLGNRRLFEWSRNVKNGESVLTEFMAARSRGRLRHNHVYDDTESVLLDIAADRGCRDEVARWLRTPGYVPESAMYSILGDPSQIRLKR